MESTELSREDGYSPQANEPPSHTNISENPKSDAEKEETGEMVQKEQTAVSEAEAPNTEGETGNDSAASGADRNAAVNPSDVESPAPRTGPGSSGNGGIDKTSSRGAPSSDSPPVEGDRGRDEQPPETQDGCFCNFRKSLERQAALIKQCLQDTEDLQKPTPLTTETLQSQFERYVFNPQLRVPLEQREVRYNFYPPFLLPKAICNYHIFAVTVPVPPSCKANRSGTEVLSNCWRTNAFRLLPKWKPGVEINDSLGSEVVPIGELNEEIKLVPLKGDTCRLLWAKERGTHVRFFSYPSLHMPPKLSMLLMETLLQPFADEIAEPASDPAPCISDEELALIVDPGEAMTIPDRAAAMQVRRLCVTTAVRYTVELELMQRIFREESMVRKMQEVLHHTLHQGYVRVVRDTAKVNLSNFATFHGVTYSTPLNNCIAANLMEGEDKADYVLDSVYLFLVLTWQTAMGMWNQAIEAETIEAYKKVFEKQRRAIYAETSISDVTAMIVDILLNGDVLGSEMRKALPNFITQSQVSAFRHFLLERSNIPPFAAPFLPSDFVPLRYKESQPLHWGQVYLLRLAFFLLNHGGYLWEPPVDPENPDTPSPATKNYCPCNLCSPHRMPLDNMALHNEVLAIGTFEIRNPEGKSFKLTPELWTNVYLDKFESSDFFPFTVCHYQDEPSFFTAELRACVTQTPEILSLIRRIQESREEFLLTKGKGVYKDPQTGEVLSGDGHDRPRLPAGQGGPNRQRPALPPPANYQSGRAKPPEKAPRALRSACETGNGCLPSPDAGKRSGTPADTQHDTKHDQREGNRHGGGRSPVTTSNPKRRHRRRVPRQPGLALRDIGGRGIPHSTASTAEKAPSVILRKDSGESRGTENER